jgi:membrane protein implicated in regulation of membrane protease activity
MAIYAAIGAVGFLFLLAMLFMGDFGGDHDIGGHDLGGHDVAHGDADHGPGLFSARIMAAFLTAFGVGGVVGRYYGLPHPAASGIGVLAGVVMAGLVYQFAKVLHSQQASSEVRVSSLIGKLAEVSVSIPASGVGQVVVIASGERTEHIARGANGVAVPRGTEVVVTGLRGDSLIVVPASAQVTGGAP